MQDSQTETPDDQQLEQAQKALAGCTPEMSVSEMVKEALKKIGSIK